MPLWDEVKSNKDAIKCLDHGYVVLLDVMGDDKAIVDAARVSYGNATKLSADETLLRYLMRHHHTSPFEMVEFKFLLRMPIFVMRQHVRHRTASLNEYSGRYSVMSDDMYIPGVSDLAIQHANNKQCSGDAMAEEIGNQCIEMITESSNTALSNYKACLDAGLSKELARIQLPVSNYTELYWKIDLKNLLHYIRLRDDHHAQPAIQVYANAMYELIKRYVPVTCKAFDDYMSLSNTATLSRMDIGILRSLVSQDKWEEMTSQFESPEEYAKSSSMTMRELTEFMEKFNLHWRGATL